MMKQKKINILKYYYNVMYEWNELLHRIGFITDDKYVKNKFDYENILNELDKQDDYS